MVSFTPFPLNSRGKSPRYPLDRRLGGPQSRSGRSGEEEIPGGGGEAVRSESIRVRVYGILNVSVNTTILY
jgi:hypothetical protein